MGSGKIDKAKKKEEEKKTEKQRGREKRILLK
jgi:hypothetical protein